MRSGPASRLRSWPPAGLRDGWLARIDYEIARHGRSRLTFAHRSPQRRRHLPQEVVPGRIQDTVAGVGGDEFCVLAPETDTAGAHRLIARVEASVARVVAGVDALGASAGAAIFPLDATTPDSLLEAADQRLLGAKAVRGRRRAAA